MHATYKKTKLDLWQTKKRIPGMVGTLFVQYNIRLNGMVIFDCTVYLQVSIPQVFCRLGTEVEPLITAVEKSWDATLPLAWHINIK